jgi:L-ascorbate metabolism protein UlaG (beta-lactamase superfamily)
LQLPTPDTEDEWFNIVIDPWLTGPQTDFHKRFSQQWHGIKPCVENLNNFGIQIDAVIVSHEFSDYCHRATH